MAEWEFTAEGVRAGKRPRSLTRAVGPLSMRWFIKAVRRAAGRDY